MLGGAGRQRSADVCRVHQAVHLEGASGHLAAGTAAFRGLPAHSERCRCRNGIWPLPYSVRDLDRRRANTPREPAYSPGLDSRESNTFCSTRCAEYVQIQYKFKLIGSNTVEIKKRMILIFDYFFFASAENRQPSSVAATFNGRRTKR